MFRVIVIGKQSKTKKGGKMTKERITEGETMYENKMGKRIKNKEWKKKNGQTVPLWGTEVPIWLTSSQQLDLRDQVVSCPR
jgi:uncharacterized membrane protein